MKCMRGDNKMLTRCEKDVSKIKQGIGNFLFLSEL